MGKHRNILVTFLDLLGVKHTRSFADRLYNEHPHRYNMFGLSKVLSEYGIENKGLITENKEGAIKSLTVPFLAQWTTGDFAIVTEMTASNINFLWRGLWSVFIINLLYASFRLQEAFTLEDTLLVGVVFFIPTAVINLTIPVLSQVKKTEQITQRFNAFKMNEDVFYPFLQRQKRYDVDKSVSKILFGNPDSKTLITVLTNPHCAPCARMHFRIEKLLKNTGDSFCVQYIFTSFYEEVESSAHFLISAYLKFPLETVKTVYSEWFKEGKYRREDFYSRYACEQDEETENEFLQHKKWKETVQIYGTPTILINGYELPDNYKIEDLKFLADFNGDF